MRAELVNVSIPQTPDSVSTGHLLSVMQQVLADFGWEDLRPAIYAAEQVDREIAAELAAAHQAFLDEPEPSQYRRLQSALDQAIEALQANYQHVRNLQAQAEERLAKSRAAETSSSYISLLSGWIYNELQQFFDSDDAALIKRYDEISKNRQESLTVLRRYRYSLVKIEIEEGLEPEGGIESQEVDSLTEENSSRHHYNRRLLAYPLTEEFRVNTYTASNQYNPSIATLNDGGFVIAWNSDAQDGDAHGVYAQRYNADGSPLGSEFRVNTVTVNDQYVSNIAALNDGGFVIAWISNAQDGDAQGVYAQLYNADGSALGGEFQVNTVTVGDQGNPSIAALGDRGFVITWQSAGQDGSSWGVYARLYSNSSSPSGDEFRVNTVTASYQSGPQIAALNEGDFVISWSSDGQDGNGSGVYAQRYSASGSPSDSEFRVNTYTAGHQRSPSITNLSDGGFVIVWSSVGQDGDGSGVYAQRYSANGSPSGSEFRVNTFTTGDQRFPSIAALSDGSFVIAWESVQDGSGYGIYAQYYDTSGSPIGGEFRVNTYTPSYQVSSSIAALNNSGFVITWESGGQDGNGTGVYARLFSGNPSTLTPTPTPTLIPTPTPTPIVFSSSSSSTATSGMSQNSVMGSGSVTGGSMSGSSSVFPSSASSSTNLSGGSSSHSTIDVSTPTTTDSTPVPTTPIPMSAISSSSSSEISLSVSQDSGSSSGQAVESSTGMSGSKIDGVSHASISLNSISGDSDSISSESSASTGPIASRSNSSNSLSDRSEISEVNTSAVGSPPTSSSEYSSVSSSAMSNPDSSHSFFKESSTGVSATGGSTAVSSIHSLLSSYFSSSSGLAMGDSDKPISTPTSTSSSTVITATSIAGSVSLTAIIAGLIYWMWKRRQHLLGHVPADVLPSNVIQQSNLITIKKEAKNAKNIPLNDDGQADVHGHGIIPAETKISTEEEDEKKNHVVHVHLSAEALPLYEEVELASLSQEKKQHMVHTSMGIDPDDLEIDHEHQLGHGGYGTVHPGFLNGEPVAIKKLARQHLSDDQKELIKEAKTMASVSTKSNHLVVLRGLCIRGHYNFLVMELMNGGSLYGLLQKKSDLPLVVVYKIALDIGRGLLALHQNKILHRDLKSANVLLEKLYEESDPTSCLAKISDFGLAKVKSEGVSSGETKGEVGTRGWMAPELFDGPPPKADYSLDIYAFGMILWELIPKPQYRIPFQGVKLEDFKQEKIKRGLEQEVIPLESKECPDEFGELIRSCWRRAPADRPTAKKLATSLQQLFEEKSKGLMKPAVLEQETVGCRIA